MQPKPNPVFLLSSFIVVVSLACNAVLAPQTSQSPLTAAPSLESPPTQSRPAPTSSTETSG